MLYKFNLLSGVVALKTSKTQRAVCLKDKSDPQRLLPSDGSLKAPLLTTFSSLELHIRKASVLGHSLATS